MSILSEHFVEPELGKLIKMYGYSRGTGARIKNQRISDLKKRYICTPQLADLMDVHTIIYPGTVSDAIRYVFEELSVTDVLPGQIVDVLRGWGIMCDAVNMVIQRDRVTNNIKEVQFRLYAKKSGRERYVYFGHVSLVVTKSSVALAKVQQYWERIIKAWRYSESVRLSSIFRNKLSVAKLIDERGHLFMNKYESYVNS